MSLSRLHCGGYSTFDAPSRTNLRPHTSHPPEGRFLTAGPSSLEEGQTEVSNAPPPCHESFVGLWRTSRKGLYPAELEDRKNLYPAERESLYMDSKC
ncbi:hypothetical protein TNCV_4946421 [Trichonephila clavipes]|nr:hypothetical protein TNCV_4946421 [Trichonephila clavipes]